MVCSLIDHIKDRPWKIVADLFAGLALYFLTLNTDLLLDKCLYS